MTNSRHPFVAASTYYFNACLADPNSTLLVDQVDLLRHAVRLCQKQRPFMINAAVVLPAQIQMIWTLPVGDVDFSARWRMIKSTFSRHVTTITAQTRSPDSIKGFEDGIWQPKLWEHLISDQEDYALHDHLIATAPLRAGLIRDGSNWPLCSAYKRRLRFTVPRKMSSVA